MKLMKRTLFAASTLMSFVALAMPTAKELQSAQLMVKEVMAPEEQEFKAKRKTAAEVAESARKGALAANDEASKFLFLKGAFFYDLRAQDYPAAERTMEALRGTVIDLPDATLVEVLSTALKGVPRKNCGNLYSLLDLARVKVRTARRIAELEKQYAARHGKETLLKLAECRAVMGDWEKALSAFAACGGEAGKIAKLELDAGEKGAVAVDSADFWWGYVIPGEELMTESFRAHAAALYRRALETNALDGMRRVLAEKRVKEMSGTVAVAQETERIANNLLVFKGDAAVLNLPGCDPIEFVKCPAGSFPLLVDFGGGAMPPMGDAYRRTVRITRPFWISKNKISRGQWHAVMGKADPVLTAANLDGDVAKLSMERRTVREGISKCSMSDQDLKAPDAMVAVMAPRVQATLPHGYVLRLPSNAEWEYAFHANSTRQDDLYSLHKPMVKVFDALHKAASEDTDGKGGEKWLREAVAQRKQVWHLVHFIPCDCGVPNDWGLYGMYMERVLDRMSSAECETMVGRLGHESFVTVVKLKPTVPADDPFYWAEEETPCAIRSWSFGVSIGHWDWRGFRLVIGPDLVGEWKARHGKK